MAAQIKPATSPSLPKRAIPSLCLTVYLAFVSCSVPLHCESAEGATNNGAFWAAEGLFTDDDQNGGKATGGAVAGKVLGFMSKVVGEVGNDVKNSLLYGMSKLRTSEKYKKAKYLINAPDVDTGWVSTRLQKWGTDTLRFAHFYACMSPETRAALLKLSVQEIPSFGRVNRKYVHIGEVPDADSCYKSLVAVRGALEETLDRIKVRTKMQPRRAASSTANYFDVLPSHLVPAGSAFRAEDNQSTNFESPTVDNATDLEIRRAAQLIQLVIKQQPRILFYLVHPFSNTKTLANELSFYLSKMLPTAKQVFALTWRLNSVLPPSPALANKRMLADYLDDALEFEEGLHAVLETRRGYPCEYNPHDDYYFIPPPPPAVLQAPPLSDSL